MNMVLSDVEETIYVVDTDESTAESVVRVSPHTLLGYTDIRLTAGSRDCRPSSGIATCSLSEETASSSSVPSFPPLLSLD